MFLSVLQKTLRGWLPLLAVASVLVVAGCATGRGGYAAPGGEYGTTYRTDRTGIVQSVRRVTLRKGDDKHVLGTVIGAVAGGLLGNTVGNGDGRKAATVVGAVAGGVAGHAIAGRDDDSGDAAWQVVVRMDDGRIATVTQRDAPRARVGDRVQVRDDRVVLL